MYKKLETINIYSVPADPLKVVALNRWQIISYRMFAYMLRSNLYEVRRLFGSKAFVIYSTYQKTYIIVYDDTETVTEFLRNISHEIGHIFYGHVGPGQLILRGSDTSEDQEQQADDFARHILGQGGSIWIEKAQ